MNLSHDKLPVTQAELDLNSLFETNKFSNLTNLYLQLLYSQKAAELAKEKLNAQSASPLVLKLLKTINFDRLSIEREARIGNLTTQLARICRIFFSICPRPRARVYVAQFCQSNLFWEFKGRSLEENFAVFLFDHLKSEGEFGLAEVIKLDGIISAVQIATDLESPWKDSTSIPSQTVNEMVIPCEEYETPFPLVDSRNILINADNLQELMKYPVGPYSASVRLVPENQVVVRSMRKSV